MCVCVCTWMDVKYLSYGIFYLNYTSLSWIKEKNFSSIHKENNFFSFRDYWRTRRQKTLVEQRLIYYTSGFLIQLV